MSIIEQGLNDATCQKTLICELIEGAIYLNIMTQQANDIYVKLDQPNVDLHTWYKRFYEDLTIKLNGIISNFSHILNTFDEHEIMKSNYLNDVLERSYVESRLRQLVKRYEFVLHTQLKSTSFFNRWYMKDECCTNPMIEFNQKVKQILEKCMNHSNAPLIDNDLFVVDKKQCKYYMLM